MFNDNDVIYYINLDTHSQGVLVYVCLCVFVLTCVPQIIASAQHIHTLLMSNPISSSQYQHPAQCCPVLIKDILLPNLNWLLIVESVCIYSIPASILSNVLDRRTLFKMTLICPLTQNLSFSQILFRLSNLSLPEYLLFHRFREYLVMHKGLSINFREGYF